MSTSSNLKISDKTCELIYGTLTATAYLTRLETQYSSWTNC